MCSSINELIEWIESERVRISYDYARLSYCEEWESTLYYNVDIDFSILIRLIKTELDDDFLSDDLTEKYKNLRDNWLESIYFCSEMDAN